VSDFITYRFPGKDTHHEVGNFIEKDISSDINGFFVTNFDRSKIYVFQTSQHGDKTYHFVEEKPYCMTPREYYLQAHELLNGLNVMQMQKAVFSRIKQVAFDKTKIEAFFSRLCEKYPKAFVYLISSDLFGTWIGASPEIVMEAHQRFLFTTSLAGTKKTTETNKEWSTKEITEQKIVTDYVLNILQQHKMSGVEQNGPYDYEAGPVTHLRTDISADLADKDPFEIALSLHPTPAVSGFPKELAIHLIQSIEPHQRDLYTGMIGVNETDSCKIYVNLRCAQIQENNLYLYLGGGYTPESIPEMEWIETENKSKTLINCIN
jgi:isochorismate synthase